MGFFETLLITAGIAATKTAATDMVRKSTSMFSEKFLTPLLEEKKSSKELAISARKYIAAIDKSTKFITTVAISGGASQLGDLYVPLTLIDQAAEKSYLLNKYPNELFNENRLVLLTDTAGMGKSTALKFIVQASLVELQVLPILVELRKIPKEISVFDYMFNQFLGKESAANKVCLREILESGKVLILLDGYDEIEDDLRKKINQDIAELSIQYDKCFFIVASRPDSELKALAGFKEFNIQPLSQKEAFELLKKYDKKGSVAERLIAKVRTNHEIREFLGNPLMVSLLFKAFDYKATIPLKKHIFFRQVYDALYQDHDLGKGAFERKKKTGLDIEDFHKAVRAVGIVTFFLGKVQYQSEQFHAALDSTKKVVHSLSFDSSKLRSDLISAVPLFSKDGTEIRWTHKAFQDYFAAQYIFYDSGVSRDEFIRKLDDSDNPRKNENIFLILADLDRELVNRITVSPILERLLEEHSDGEFPNTDAGFKIFLCSKIGDIYIAGEKYRRQILKDDLSGFTDFLRDVTVLEGRSISFSQAHTLHSKNHAIVALVRDSLDKINFVNSLSWSRQRTSFDYSPVESFVESARVGDDTIAKLFDIDKAQSQVDIDRIINVYQAVHSVRLPSLQEARTVVDNAKNPPPEGVDWLISQVPKSG